MMNDKWNMILAFIAGLFLGAMFFGGLWLTVRRAAASTKPAMLILGSFVFRMALALIGFYFIGAGNWQRLLTALLGFILARLLVLHFTKTKQSIVRKEVVHET